MESEVRYYLAQQVPFTLAQALVFQNSQLSLSNIIPPIIPVVRSVADGAEQKELTAKLRVLFEGRNLILRLQKSPNKFGSGRGETEFRLNFVGSSGPNLIGDFEYTTLFLQAEIIAELVSTVNGLPNQQQVFTTREIPVTHPKENKVLPLIKDCTYNPVIDSLVGLQHQDGQNRVIKGKMNLILIDKPSVCTPLDGDKMAAVYKRMLEEEIAPDAFIVPSNGVEVKCHRGILATHSDVFRDMFATDVQEAMPYRIEMLEMSEMGVRAFLAYLYHWDLSKAVESCTVAVELLKAGHRYNIGSLEEVTWKLLLSKPESWYVVDVAMKMFLFTRDLDGEWDPLRKKAVMVMKGNCADLTNSAAVRELFREDPDAALQFYQYSISV